MRIFSKITAALAVVAVVGVCTSNVAYAGGHHARAVTMYGICQNSGICTGTVNQPQLYYGCYPEYYSGCYAGYSYGHHSGGCHGAYHH